MEWWQYLLTLVGACTLSAAVGYAVACFLFIGRDDE